MNENLDALVASVSDENAKQWIRDAVAAGWTGIDEILDASYTVHGTRGAGLHRCRACDAPVVDVAVWDGDGAAVLITDEDGIGATPLCRECYDAAVAARRKIVVTKCDDGEGTEYLEEDDSALTDEEKQLATLLDKQDAGQARQSRDLIRGYPRDERKDLHRYQDRIDAERSLRGKQVRND